MNQGSYDLRRDVDKLQNKTDELAKDYYIEVNSPVVTYKDETYTPSTLVANAYVSSREVTDFYDGIIDLWVSMDGGNTWGSEPVKVVQGHTLSQSINDTRITNLKVNLYDEDFNVLDWQTISVVRTTKGSAGQGYDFIYYTTEKSTLSSSDYPVNGRDYTALTGNYNEWLQTPKQINDSHPNVFMSYRTSDDAGHWGNWSTPVKYNARGERGEDGEGLEMIFCRTQYADGYSVDPSTLNPVQQDDWYPPNTGWSDDQKGVTSTYCFEYVCMRTKEVPTGGKVAQWGPFSSPKLWATYSEDGKDGKGIELIFRRNNDPTTAPTFSNNQNNKSYSGVDRNNKHFNDDDFVPDNWTDDQTGVDENNQCEWVAKRIKKVTNGVASWESFNSPQLWATWSEDGISVQLGNESQLIPVYANGTLKDNPTVITIPVYCYKGTTRVAGTINISDVSNKFSTKTITQQPTASNDGLVTLQCTTTPNTITNSEPIKVTVDGKTFTKYFTWHKIGDGNDGNDGGTYDFVYYAKSTDVAPSKPSASQTINDNTGKNTYDTWCARPSNLDSAHPFCFASYIKKVNGVKTGEYSDVFSWRNYGFRGNGAINLTGTPYEYSGTVGDGLTAYYRYRMSDAISESGLSEVLVGDYFVSSYYIYPIIYLGITWAYTGQRISIRGASGRAVASVENQYASGTSKTTPPTSNWKTDITQVTTFNTTNKYLWNKEISKDADNEIISESTPVVIAEYGKNGGISSITEEYALSIDTTAPSTGWDTNIHQMSSTNKYLWNREIITYINNVQYTTTAKIIGVYGDSGIDGEDGADGEGLEMIFKRTTTNTAPTFITDAYGNQGSSSYSGVIDGRRFQDPDFLPSGWTDDQTGVNENNQYEWVSMRTKIPDTVTDPSGKTLKWDSFNSPSLWAKWGEQGIPGIDGNSVSTTGVMSKVEHSNLEDTTVGSMSNSVPSDFVASYVNSVTYTKSDSAFGDRIESGTVEVARQGNIVVVTFRNLILKSTFPMPSNPSDHTNAFTTPSWAKPSDIIYFSNIMDNSRLSVTGSYIRVFRAETTSLNMTGTVTYFVEENEGKTLTSLEWNTLEATLAQGSDLEVILKDSSSRRLVGYIIYFRINGVLYKRTTDSNGKVSISINLPSGQYDIIAWFDGSRYDENGEYKGSTGEYRYSELTSPPDAASKFTVNKASASITLSNGTSVGGGTEYYALFTGPNPIRNHTVFLNIGGSGWAKMETDRDGKVYFRLDGYHGSTTVQAKIESSNRVSSTVTNSKTYTLS